MYSLVENRHITELPKADPELSRPSTLAPGASSCSSKLPTTKQRARAESPSGKAPVSLSPFSHLRNQVICLHLRTVPGQTEWIPNLLAHFGQSEHFNLHSRSSCPSCPHNRAVEQEGPPLKRNPICSSQLDTIVSRASLDFPRFLVTPFSSSLLFLHLQFHPGILRKVRTPYSAPLDSLSSLLSEA